MPTSIAIRLGVEGGAEVKRVLQDAGAAGQAAFQGVGAAADASGAAADRQTARYQKMAQAAREAEAQARAQANINSLLGVSPAAAGAARASASVFETQADAAEDAARRVGNAQRSMAAGFQALQAQGSAQLSAIQAQANSRAANLEASRRLGSIGQMPALAPAANENGRLRQDQAQNLLYQGGDIVAQLGSGSPLSMIALQQGPQIAQVFAGSGGASIKGAAIQASEAVGSFVSRIGVAGAAFGIVTTAAVTGAAAMLSYQNSMRETERLVSGVGRASGVSADQINTYARAASDATGISTRAAREAGGQLAATGRIGGEVVAKLLGSLEDYTKTSGQAVPDAAQELAKAFADPSKGADLLNERLGFLDDRTAQSIRTLQAQGDRLGAQRVLFDAYAGSLTKAADLTTAWGRATDTAFGPVKNLWDFIGQQADKAFNGGSLEERLENATVRLRNIRERMAGPGGSFVSRPLATSTQKEVDDLTRQMEERTRRSTQAAAAQSSRELGDLVRQLDPAGVGLREIQDRVEKLRKAISDPLRLGLDPILLAQTQSVFERMSVAARNMRDDMERFGDAAVASASRQADLQNRLSTDRANPVDRQIAERRFQFEEELRKRNIDPSATRESIAKPYNDRLNDPNLDPRELQSIVAAREVALQTIVEREGLTKVLNTELDTMKRETETRASRSQNVNSFMERVVGVESRGDTNARNPLSTATGLGQFIESTWLRLFKDRFPERAAGMSREEILARRTDRGDSVELIRVLTEQNSRFLEKAGLATTDRNLYLAHFAGAQGAVDLLRADRGASAESVLGANAARSNPSIVGGGRSVGSVIDWADRTINRGAPAIRVSEREVAVLRTQTTLTDQTTEAESRRQKIQELLNAEIERGTVLGRSFTTAQDLLKASASQLTPEMAAQRDVILKTADAYGKAQAGLENSRIGRDILFDRAQLDRSPQDQSVASRLRGTGLGMDSAEADALRLNDNLRQTRELGNTVFSGMLGDLRQGVSAATLLGNITGRLADKLLSTASDRVISGLFGGADKGGGGFLSSLAGLFGSGALPKFAEGGVSSGPSIFGEAGPEAAVPLSRGRAIPVELRVPRIQPVAAANFNQPPPVFAPNIITPPGYVAQTREVDDGRGGRKPEISFAEVTAQGIRSPQGQAALNRRKVVST
ncbi:phage tail length tape measure family protein [Methylobacterium sp. Leaf88]|uniref:phage tail length tape measure family protein n=1 Tax=Methylobacterium sp. Leaf88 TaxID=1736244 RepID=UPI0006F52DFB|nr:phage tail length tape measure family protein [Methylobacterium sp. Leaf88]KQO76421.1 hypothetical protein ASF20_13820 [Methylobacterium sp. Leaf88]